MAQTLLPSPNLGIGCAKVRLDTDFLVVLGRFSRLIQTLTLFGNSHGIAKCRV